MAFEIADYAALLSGKRVCFLGPECELQSACRKLFASQGGEVTAESESADILVCGFLSDTETDPVKAMTEGYLNQLPFLRTALEGQKSRRGGTIVAVVPACGANPSPDTAACAGAAAALEGYIRSAAMEGAKFRVRANVVRYGWQTGDRAKALVKAEGEAGETLLREGQPIRRPGTAEEIAEAALFLASPMSAFITAESVTVDGGVHAVGHNNISNADHFTLPHREVTP